jgi:DNA topoisomerase 2-associated protein PAT1
MVCYPTGNAEGSLLTSRNKTFAYFLQVILPHLPELFPAAIVQKTAFGPSAYLIGNDENDKTGTEMERREAEVWGLAAALAVNAPEDQQTNLVAALREKVRYTDHGARGWSMLMLDPSHSSICSSAGHLASEGGAQAEER